MNNTLLIVVDMQNDFVTGVLGTPEAQAIVPRVVEKVDKAQAVLFTMDTHNDRYLEKQEGRMLPIPHCLIGTEGREIIPQLAGRVDDFNLFTKGQFACRDLIGEVNDFIKYNSIDGVELIGVCTDICVVSNALLLKAFFPELPISVDASACAGTTSENHKAALDVMRVCQIKITGDGAL